MREMKDSGIEWIGEIPKNWEIRKIKQIVDYEKENPYTDGDWIEAPYIENDGIRYLTTGNIGDGKFKEQGNGYISLETFYKLKCKYAYPNDLIISRLNEPLGRSCILPETFPQYVLAVDNVILRPQKDYMIPFICYITQCDGYHLSVKDLAKGTTMKRISRTNLATIQLAFPKFLEQQRIVSFLDVKCAEIDNVIVKSRDSIEEYRKLKQSVITQAVTKGIRPNRQMKDSGIEWYSTVPNDVEISRVGLHFIVILGKMLCPNKIDDNYSLEPYFCAGDVHFEGISQTERKMMWFTEKEKEQYKVKNGDLLVVEGGAGAGGCTVVKELEQDTYIQNSIMIVRPKCSTDCRYLQYYLEYLVKQGYIDIACNKATIPHFTKDKLSNVPYIVFEDIEQQEIADYLDEKCSAIDELIAKKEQFIVEMENYKKSLIYEYVTGKKEVQ